MSTRARAWRALDAVVGLMTGTSVDGVEAALVSLRGEPPRLSWKLKRAPAPRRSTRRCAARIRRPRRGDRVRRPPTSPRSTPRWASSTRPRCSSCSPKRGVAPAEVSGDRSPRADDLPPRRARPGVARARAALTWQIGSAAVLAERTGIRGRARLPHRPTSPPAARARRSCRYVDYLLFRSEHVARGLLEPGRHREPDGDAGGAAPGARSSRSTPGPGTCCSIAIVQRFDRGRLSYDEDGLRAVGGAPDAALLAEALADPFFDLAPPRSTGRERFGAAFLESWFADGRGARAERGRPARHRRDAVGVGRRAGDRGLRGAELRARGGLRERGGTENPVLMAALEAALDPIELHVIDELGLPVRGEGGGRVRGARVRVAAPPHRQPARRDRARRGPLILGSVTRRAAVAAQGAA